MVGGTTLGYCATGNLSSATAPMTTIRMASTFARTGRSMKNFEIMTRALLRCGRLRRRRLRYLQLRIDLLPGDRVEDALHDDAILRLEPAVDDAHLADRLAGLHPALVDDVVGIDHQHVATGLVGSQRDLWHQQRPLRAQGHADANEITRQQSRRPVLEYSAHLQRAGRLIDLGGEIGR